MILGLASAALAGPAAAQSVEIKTDSNGQLSGSASAGGVRSTVNTGNSAESRVWDERNPCTPGGQSRSVRVVSPEGSSSSSSSVSTSNGGAVSAAGGGSPGSRIYEQGCPRPQAAGTVDYRSSAAATPLHRRPASRHPVRHRTRRP
jgi:hypothetical protein